MTMKKTLITIMTLCCFAFVAEAQKTKVVLETLQRETQSLQRKVDSLERLSWQQEALIKTLESRVEKLNDKLYEQAEAFNKRMDGFDKKMEGLASTASKVVEKPFELIQDEQYNADRLRVRHGAYYGFIDRSENLVIPCVYDSAYSFFDNGFVAVKKNGKWGIIDTNEKVIIPFEYDDVNWYTDERYMCLKKNNKWGVAQLSSGKITSPCQYDSIDQGVWNQDAHHFIVEKNGKWGVMDVSGRTIVNFVFSSSAYWSSSKHVYRASGSSDYYDIKGNKVR